MPESKNQEHGVGETTNAYGSIKIAEDAVAGIVSLAAAQIKGVAAMSGSMASGITEKLGKKNLAKGVKVEIEEQDVKIALHINVEYGVRIPQLAQEMQNKVRDTVQTMTGLKVKEVNIYVQGISFDHLETVEDSAENKETQEIDGEEFRYLFDLPSASFEMEQEKTQVIFRVTGVGHGFGMSQYGANCMALNGETYDQILAEFFFRTELAKFE